MSHDDELFELSFPTMNNIHDESLIQHFEDGVNRRILVISPSFPFFFIGTLVEVVEDYAVINVETTPNQSMENRTWHVHIDRIELFFIERDNGPRIPELKDDVF